jgi:predicted Zn-dependent peptidase
MADLRAASLDDVARFFSAHYAPNNAVLAVAGDFEPDRTLDMIERHFGPIPANPHIPDPPTMTVAATLGRETRQTVADDVELPRVYVASRIPPWGTDGFSAFEVLSDLLGTGRAARLEQRLVRELRLAQDVASFVFPFAFGAAVFVASATARPGVDIEAVEGALLEEITAVGTIGPSETELGRVRILYRTRMATDLEGAAERAERLMTYELLFNEPRLLHTEVDRYESVSPPDIRDAWGVYGNRDNRVVLTFVPEGAPAQP